MINEDTICAISTAAGPGALAVIRLSGQDALAIADNVFEFPGKKKRLIVQKANTLHFGRIHANGEYLDEVVAGIFKGPHSYTGEDIVEISCHGSVYIQQKILQLLIENGARLAKPGEFTLRAFLNGKMDLSQAEGVADLIASGSEASHRLAYQQMKGGFSMEIKHLRNELLQFISLIELELDFSEEDVEFADRKQLTDLIDRIIKTIGSLKDSFEYGNVIKNGIPVAIVGPANAGKSTLLNALIQEEKSIVSETPGTTRDYIEDMLVIEGIQFRFIDTAGLRHTENKIETEGIQRTYKQFRQASVVIVVIDVHEKTGIVNESLQFMREENNENKQIVLALNKTDEISGKEATQLADAYKESWSDMAHVLSISAKTGYQIDVLKNLLVSLALKRKHGEYDVVVTNTRHFEALKHAFDGLERAKKSLQESLPGDLLAQDIREVLHYLGEITGEITTDEILGNIFRNFCIGK
ncbi:MAG: tRNA uridine-5-carboxymethylaminomethyl(34) synthesis GTPase MnmE [Bacteroidales bacterium]|jgi:tRNA modification GTPase